MRRHRGICLPLSSMPASASWGIGEIPELVPMARWLQAADCDQLMLLPVGTMLEGADGQTSPYSACSAMAIDPIYVSLASLQDFSHAGGMEQLPLDLRQSHVAVTLSPVVRFAAVRRLKQAALWSAFERFLRDEWNSRTIRAGAFAAFSSRERWWLDDYALFQACAAEWPDGSWKEWPAAIARRHPSGLTEARHHFGRRILFEQYVQWVADEQWQQARQSAKALGVSLFGDLPFVVDAHSADVWARQDEFLTEVSVGVPPDAFSDTGQDWGLPMYRWDVVHRSDFDWLRQRGRRMASLYDGFRVDHLVGFYRTYGTAPSGERFFLPPDEHTQAWQGDRAIRAFMESGVDVVAEDLGTVPDFVRASIASLGVGGYKVLRWERAWHLPGRPFVSPSEYPSRSVATTGTHDTEPVAAWWDHAAPEDRLALAEVLHRVGIAAWDPSAPWSDDLRDAILRLMATTASDHLFFPIQDVFGWRDRINTPATVGDHNWTWRLPWSVDEWLSRDECTERAAFLRGL
ncbi:MAG: 4-alpha-glucanotransferase [Vicinamibacterales bacterium]